MELAKKEAEKYQSWANEKGKKTTTKKTVRKEMLPEWLSMDYSQKEESEQTEHVDVEQKRRELKELLQKYGNE